MAFSSTVKLAALQRADGRCECTRARHAHAGPCTQRVTLATARFQHVVPRSRHGHDGLANCEVLCANCCSVREPREWAPVWS
jgi:5-methylcytosine-specific restriction endonuclease McrA